jgi:hypothetical protein
MPPESPFFYLKPLKAFAPTGLFYAIEIGQHLTGHLQCPEEEMMTSCFKANVMPKRSQRTLT